MAEHRVPMLRLQRAGLRRRVDPERSTDPRVRELVSALATLEVAPAPRAEFRAELRAQLIAVAPRLIAEGEPRAVPAATGTADALDSVTKKKAGFRFARPLVAAACVLTAFVLLLGGAVLLSQRALPGDALYGLKRASENTQYGLTGGTVAKGKLKLDFAGRRIGEVGDLLPRDTALAAGDGMVADSGAINASTSKLVRETLDSADGDVTSAAQMLGAAAVRGNSAGPLNAITDWAPGQISEMNQIVDRIPAGSLHNRAVATRNVIMSAQTRANTLKSELGCSCLRSSRTDQFGPVPCTTGCSAAKSPVPTPGSSGTPGTPGTSGKSRTRVVTPGGATLPAHPLSPGSTSGAVPGVGAVTPSAGATTSPPDGATSKVPIPKLTTPHTLPGLPTLPGHASITLPNPLSSLTTAKLPITVNTCGVKASLGGLGIGIGGC